MLLNSKEDCEGVDFISHPVSMFMVVSQRRKKNNIACHLQQFQRYFSTIS